MAEQAAADHVYEPGPEFARHAHVQGMNGYRALYERAKEKPESFGESSRKRNYLV